MIRDEIRAELPETAFVFDNPSYDNSIVGVSEDDRVVYDYYKMVEELVSDNSSEGYEMTEEEAIDFISYNTIRALSYFTGEGKPIVMFPMDLGYEPMTVVSDEPKPDEVSDETN